MTMLPPDGNLYPAVGMHSEGEEVKVMLDAEWHYEDLELMAVDDGEDDWSRLHDVKLNGTVRPYLERFSDGSADSGTVRPKLYT